MFWGRYLIFLMIGIMPLYGYAYNKYHRSHYQTSKCKKFKQKKKKDRLPYRLVNGVANLLEEAILLNRNLLSLDTVKVFTAFTPLYIATRMADHPLHEKFYNVHHHKNKNQMPDTFVKIVNKGGDIGIISLTSLAFFASDEKLRLTARIFGIGAASALLAKDIVKTMRVKACIRPWNEKFSNKKHAYGGFPSGHMIEASYMLTLWGLQYGLKAAIPLGLFAGLSFGVLVGSNRHFISQVIAGAGFGVAYGLAANSLINTKISETITFDFCYNERKLPTISLAYSF